MKDRIAAFLAAVDEALVAEAGTDTLKVYHIGRSSLV